MGFERRPRVPVLLRAAPCCAVSEVIRLTFKPSAYMSPRIQNSRAVLSLSQDAAAHPRLTTHPY
jgi:hypothetical protein